MGDDKIIQRIECLTKEVGDDKIEIMIEDVLSALLFESKAKIITSIINYLRKINNHPQKIKINEIALLIGNVACSKYPDNAYFLATYTTCLIQSKRGSEAIPLITEFLNRALHPNLTDLDIVHLTINLSSGYKTIGNYTEGIKCLEALDVKPENVGRALAELYYYASEYEKTIAVAEAYYPINHQMAKWYAKALYASGKHQEAIKALEPFNGPPTIRQLKHEFELKQSILQTSAMIHNSSLNKQIFFVSGNEGTAHQSVTGYLESLNLRLVNLSGQSIRGNSFLDNFKKNSDVSFAVVLVSADDIGHPLDNPAKARSRASQNVILELGFLMGKLSPARVCILCAGPVELPSELLGLQYIPIDVQECWKKQLTAKLKQASIAVDMSGMATLSNPHVLLSAQTLSTL